MEMVKVKVKGERWGETPLESAALYRQIRQESNVQNFESHTLMCCGMSLPGELQSPLMAA